MMTSNNNTSHLNEKSSAANLEKEKIFLKIKETIKARQGNRIETLDFKSDLNSLDLSPSVQIEKKNEEEKTVEIPFKLKLFDSSDFVD